MFRVFWIRCQWKCAPAPAPWVWLGDRAKLGSDWVREGVKFRERVKLGSDWVAKGVQPGPNWLGERVKPGSDWLAPRVKLGPSWLGQRVKLGSDSTESGRGSNSRSESNSDPTESGRESNWDQTDSAVLGAHRAVTGLYLNRFVQNTLCCSNRSLLLFVALNAWSKRFPLLFYPVLLCLCLLYLPTPGMQPIFVLHVCFLAPLSSTHTHTLLIDDSSIIVCESALILYKYIK